MLSSAIDLNFVKKKKKLNKNLSQFNSKQSFLKYNGTFFETIHQRSNHIDNMKFIKCPHEKISIRNIQVTSSLNDFKI